LPVSASIDFDVPAMHVGLQNIGDPFASLAAGGFGKQGRGGIGNVPGCCGIGDDGGKPGLCGGIGQPTRPAELTYRVEPEFSEEARKAKFQGMVVLMIEIGVDGRAHNLKLVQPIGLGLDQKAIEAVAQWRFRPAQRGGKPLASTARVEVFFHLL
jgi:TonB family protein